MILSWVRESRTWDMYPQRKNSRMPWEVHISRYVSKETKIPFSVFLLNINITPGIWRSTWLLSPGTTSWTSSLKHDSSHFFMTKQVSSAWLRFTASMPLWLLKELCDSSTTPQATTIKSDQDVLLHFASSLHICARLCQPPNWRFPSSLLPGNWKL